ncbi:MAG TPA: hypothetical protein PK668_10255 [Myxococcota bacterium]|nr:hypothetical protein [Myxococcota bacterium]HRY93451.1 hypothetical protein [Myxococcota bacterium]HSA20298.1 hypothetical protein [Myxococcota bacterium]
MNKITTILACLVVATLALSFAACGEDAPTCASAMNHLYGEGCTMTVNGTAVSQSEAITGCNDMRVSAGNCGCTGQFEDALDCLSGIGSSTECGGCDSFFSALNGCLSACG